MLVPRTFLSDNSTEESSTSGPAVGTEAPWEEYVTTGAQPEGGVWEEVSEETPGEYPEYPEYPTKEPIYSYEGNEIPEYGGNDV